MTRLTRSNLATSMAVAAALAAIAFGCGTEQPPAVTAGTAPSGTFLTEGTWNPYPPPYGPPVNHGPVPGSVIGGRDRRLLEQATWPSAAEMIECSYDPQHRSFFGMENRGSARLTVPFPPGSMVLPPELTEYPPNRIRPISMVTFPLPDEMAEVLRAAGVDATPGEPVAMQPYQLRSFGESRRGATVSVEVERGSHPETYGKDTLRLIQDAYSERPDGSFVFISDCQTGREEVMMDFLTWLDGRGPRTVPELLRAARDPNERERLLALEEELREAQNREGRTRPPAPLWNDVSPAERVYGDAAPPEGTILVPFSLYFEPPAAWQNDTTLICTRTVDAWNPCFPMLKQGKGELIMNGVRGIDQDVEVWVLGGGTHQPDRSYVVGRIPKEQLGDTRRPVFGLSDPVLAADAPLAGLADKSKVKDRGDLIVLRYGGRAASEKGLHIPPTAGTAPTTTR